MLKRCSWNGDTPITESAAANFADVDFVQGLGDLAAHLVAFHNMGASPAQDDPFTSDVKVDFNGENDQGSEGTNSPQAHSQPHNAPRPSFIEDRTFQRPAQVCPPAIEARALPST